MTSEFLAVIDLDTASACLEPVAIPFEGVAPSPFMGTGNNLPKLFESKPSIGATHICPCNNTPS